MTDSFGFDAKARVVSAWVVEGTAPAYHMQQKEYLRRKWPTLYYALVDLAAQTTDVK